jgi:hypothetical protein
MGIYTTSYLIFGSSFEPCEMDLGFLYGKMKEEPEFEDLREYMKQKGWDLNTDVDDIEGDIWTENIIQYYEEKDGLYLLVNVILKHLGFNGDVEYVSTCHRYDGDPEHHITFVLPTRDRQSLAQFFANPQLDSTWEKMDEIFNFVSHYHLYSEHHVS